MDWLFRESFVLSTDWHLILQQTPADHTHSPTHPPLTMQVLGPPEHHHDDDDDDDDDYDSKQRNRQFVGDLLFGHAATTHHCQTASTVVEQVSICE